MTESSPIDSRSTAAVHAYDHAREATTGLRHRVDVVDEPVLDYGAPPRRRTYFPMPWMQPGVQHVAHSIDDPTSTALKVGFGFAAGVGLFRLAVLTVVGVLLLVFVATLASAILG